MRYIRLLGHSFALQHNRKLAYRFNFFISLLHSLLNLATGVLGWWCFSPGGNLNGWDFPSTLLY